METINICGTNCRKDKLKTFTYEQLFNLAKQSGWRGDIGKELRKHGFRPSTKHKPKTESDKQSKDRKPVKG